MGRRLAVGKEMVPQDKFQVPEFKEGTGRGRGREGEGNAVDTLGCIRI